MFPMSLNGPGNPRPLEGTVNCPCSGCPIPSCIGRYRLLEPWCVVTGAGGSTGERLGGRLVNVFIRFGGQSFSTNIFVVN